MTAPDTVRRSSGFTLLEVMVALMLLALFSIVSYRALDSLLQAERHATREMSRWREVAGLFTRIEADLANAVPARPLAGGGGQPVFWMQQDEAGGVIVNWERFAPDEARGGVIQVGYRLESGQVVRVQMRAGAPAGESPMEQRWLSGIQQPSMRLLDGQGMWHGTWPAPDAGQRALGLPSALEIQFELEGGLRVRRLMLVQ